MKKLVVIVLALVAAVSCGKSERLTPEQTVQECWMRIAAGDYQGAVALMEGTEQEKGEYMLLLEEKYAAKLQKASGVERVDVLASHTNDKEVLVQAIVVLGNGAEIEDIHSLHKIDKQWLIGAYSAE
jgi:hypothetical protein